MYLCFQVDYLLRFAYIRALYVGQWTQRVTIARVKVVPVSPLFQPLSFDNEWKFHRLKNFSSIPSSERERKSCDFIFIINTLLEIITISGKFNARTFAQKEKMILLTNIRISNSTNEIQANVYFTRSHILSLNFPPSPKILQRSLTIISHPYKRFDRCNRINSSRCENCWSNLEEEVKFLISFASTQDSMQAGSNTWFRPRSRKSG